MTSLRPPAEWPGAHICSGPACCAGAEGGDDEDDAGAGLLSAVSISCSVLPARSSLLSSSMARLYSRSSSSEVRLGLPACSHMMYALMPHSSGAASGSLGISCWSCLGGASSAEALRGLPTATALRTATGGLGGPGVGGAVVGGVMGVGESFTARGGGVSGGGKVVMPRAEAHSSSIRYPAISSFSMFLHPTSNSSCCAS
mmetsp:Transcript_34276/g.65478  ORF Transcript_34276/g.65478 Transcript_34276/m.65478 type:complete len:200 (-) Transcript_34276:1049-1648(-)